MSFFNRLTAVIVTAVLVGPMMPLEARTRKGDKFITDGRAHEAKKEWDAALESYQKALSEDPADILYQMAVDKARFQTAQSHIDNGLRIRGAGQLGEALLEFQKAYIINPSSSAAAQEVSRTRDMIDRERRRVEQTGQEAAPEVRGLTPVEQMRKQSEDKIKRMLPVPELRPLNSDPIKNLKINGQTVKVLFETIGKVANINVLWDPEYQAPSKNSFNVDFENTTLEQALDNIAVITKSYWKAMSPNTIFITNDNANKRRDYAEMVAQTFYLSNVNTPQELQEIVNAVRSISELQRVVAYSSQNAIIVRGESDQVALAAKMIHDLDKAKSEVVVDVLVMEANSQFSRQITAALASTGLNLPVSFNPRSTLQTVTTTTGATGSGGSTGSVGNTGSVGGTGTTSTSTTTGNSIPISNIGKIDARDFSTVLPSALLQAAMTDTRTKVLQAPQLRSVDNVKATLKIGERQPTATGSFQPGIGGVGINPLVNTQFTYLDVGVNVEIIPRVHDNGDVSLHVDLDISNVTGHVDLGGISQPIIGQRKVQHDIRMHEGEVNLLGGLISSQESKQVTGIPGLSSIPLLRRLFTGESVDKQRNELMIVLIPHIVRRPDIQPDNIQGISVGSQQTVHINYAPRPADLISGQKAAEMLQPGAPANTPAPAASMPAAQPAAPPVNPAANLGNPQTPPVMAPGMGVPQVPQAVANPAGTTPPAAAPNAAMMPPATAPPENTPPATTATTTPAPGTNPDTPVGNARLIFSPPAIETSQGGNISLSLTIVGGTDVASAPMQIQYDPKLLKLVDVTRGEFLGIDGQPVVFTKSTNDPGMAAVQLNRPPGAGGISGGGVLVTLQFQAVGKGSGFVNVPGLTVRNSQGQVVASGSPQVAVTVQ